MPIFYLSYFILADGVGAWAGLSIAATYQLIWLGILTLFAGATYWAWRHPVARFNGDGRGLRLSLDPEH